MAQTLVEQKRPRGDRSRGNLSRLERDLKAYELHMMGCTVRGICDELKISSTQTAHSAINRGRDYCIERGINIEERKIEIDKLFKETLGHLAQTIRHQAENGCLEFFTDPEGNTSTKRRTGVDPRIAGELSRSLHRWSEFLGLMDRVPEVNQASTTLIQLSSPADGANFADRWGSDAVDVSPSANGDNHPAAEAGGQGAISPAVAGIAGYAGADLAQDLAQHPDSPTPSGRRAA